jgi:hypothetical protein
MNPLSKIVIPLTPQTVTGASTLTGVIDTLGYDYAEVVLIMNQMAATSVPTMVGLAESDVATTVFTDATAIIGSTGGAATTTAVAFVIPAMSTVVTSRYCIKWNVDLHGRKRYLDFKAVFGAEAAQTIATLARLSKGEKGPVNSTDAGVVALVEVGNKT